MTKSDNISKTKNCTKKSHACEKWAPDQFQSTLQVWPLLKKIEKRYFWTPTAPKRDMVWYEILRPSIFSAHCASFMSRWPLLRGWGRGLHIRRWETTENCIFFYRGMKTNVTIHFSVSIEGIYHLHIHLHMYIYEMS